MPRTPVSRSVQLLTALAAMTAVTLLPARTNAQSILVDALRLSGETVPASGRGLALNGALVSSAQGIEALDYNPAALVMVPLNEVGLSLLNRQHASTASFLGAPNDGSASNLAFGSIGLAAPIPTERGHLVVGLSYDRVRDYTSTYSFRGVNPSSSFLNTNGFVADPHRSLTGNAYRDYLDQTNLAWALRLTKDVEDSTASTLRTLPFNGGLEQKGIVTEEGGLRAVRIGAGIDLAEGFSVGATLNVYSGSYDYSCSYTESDVNGIYADAPDSLTPQSFQSATIVDGRHQDQFGVGLKLGLLSYALENLRVGLTVETPTLMHIDDEFVRGGSATFKRTTFSVAQGELIDTMSTFDILTPMRASLGLSGHLFGATLTGAVSYADMRNVSFSSDDFATDDLEVSAKEMFRPVVSWHVGAEYVIAPIGASVRAGYGVEPSPWKGDPASYDTKSLSGGVGILLSKSVLMEASVRNTKYHTSHTIYNDKTVEGAPARSVIDDDAVSRTDVGLSFSFRY